MSKLTPEVIRTLATIDFTDPIVVGIMRAREHSDDYPNVVVRLLDKPKRGSIISSNEDMYKKYISEGWKTVAVFQAGKLIDIPEGDE